MAFVCDNEGQLRRAQEAMLDQWLSLNIISLSFIALGLPRENIIRQPIEVLGFGGGYMCTMGFVNLDLAVGSIRAAQWIHVIESNSLYVLSMFESHLERTKGPH